MRVKNVLTMVPVPNFFKVLVQLYSPLPPVSTPLLIGP